MKKTRILYGPSVERKVAKKGRVQEEEEEEEEEEEVTEAGRYRAVYPAGGATIQ